MLKCLIFDLDGTLVRTNELHLRVMKRVFEHRYRVSVPDAVVKPLFGERTSVIFEFLLEKYGLQGSAGALVREKGKEYARLVKGRDLLKQGTRRLLERLAKRYALAIVTGSSRQALNVSLKPRHQALFSCMLTADDVKPGKPSPKPYLVVLKKLGLKRNECLVVGDSVNDLLAAKRARMKRVGVFSGFSSRKELRRQEPLKVLDSVLALEREVLRKE